MIYLDANVFIHASLGQDRRAACAADILRGVVEGEEEACTSILTWDEVAYAVFNAAGRETALEHGQRLLEFPNLRLVVADRDIAARANRAMRENRGLMPRDSIHYVTAIREGCNRLVTDDGDFDGLPGITRVPLN